MNNKQKFAEWVVRERKVILKSLDNVGFNIGDTVDFINDYGIKFYGFKILGFVGY